MASPAVANDLNSFDDGLDLDHIQDIFITIVSDLKSRAEAFNSEARKQYGYFYGMDLVGGDGGDYFL